MELSFCDDGDPCTLDRCDGGVCSVAALCDDGDPCTVDACDGGACSTRALCDDEDVCTTDRCEAGTCEYEPVVCPSGVCGVATCDPVSGCAEAPAPDGAACVSPCGEGRCAGGACEAEPLRSEWTYEAGPDRYLEFSGLVHPDGGVILHECVCDTCNESYCTSARCELLSLDARGAVRFRVPGASANAVMIADDVLLEWEASAVAGRDLDTAEVRWRTDADALADAAGVEPWMPASYLHYLTTWPGRLLLASSYRGSDGREFLFASELDLRTGRVVRSSRDWHFQGLNWVRDDRGAFFTSGFNVTRLAPWGEPSWSNPSDHDVWAAYGGRLPLTDGTLLDAATGGGWQVDEWRIEFPVLSAERRFALSYIRDTREVELRVDRVPHDDVARLPLGDRDARFSELLLLSEERVLLAQSQPPYATATALVVDHEAKVGARCELPGPGDIATETFRYGQFRLGVGEGLLYVTTTDRGEGCTFESRLTALRSPIELGTGWVMERGNRARNKGPEIDN